MKQFNLIQTVKGILFSMAVAACSNSPILVDTEIDAKKK